MKVLIISNNSLSVSSNNGKTLNSIFSFFEQHEVCQLYFHSGEEPTSTVCRSFFRLSLKDSILNWIKPTEKRAVLPNTKNLCHSRPVKEKLIPANNSIIYPILMIWRDLLWSFSRWYSSNLMEWLSIEKPTIVFFLAGNTGFTHTIAVKISRVLEIPLAIYFTDDYLLFPIKRNIIDTVFHYHLEKKYQRSLSISTMRFTIGEYMADEYSRYFNKTFTPIMNCVEVEEGRAPLANTKKSIKIVYFGGLHLGRADMILRFAIVLSSISKKYFIDVSLSIYSSSHISDSVKRMFEINNINYNRAVPSEQIPEISKNFDCFLHVESDEMYFRSLTRLSVSTKIPEYLSLFRPIIAFGPLEVASMRILSDNNIGLTISSAKEDVEIESILYEFFANYKHRQQKAIDGLKYAMDIFDRKKVAYGFRSQLLQLDA
ncbi:MAG: hypothetical protein H3C31_12930 [Brumimicrobium sp.]|nr:hypothetical protein [Brumimicrobium sp.]